MLKRWVPVSFIAAAMALALAGGAVLAVGGGTNSHRADVFERAAEILGIAPEDLQDAHDQARREARDKQFAAVVEMLLASEVIDQAEADSFTVWMADRPDSADDALFSKLTGSLFGRSIVTTGTVEIRKFQHGGTAGLTDRIAEILGIDPQELADALKDGESAVAATTRIERVHAAIDDMLASEQITADEAAELHAWVDAAPQWLLDLDVSSRRFSGLELFGGKNFDRDFLKRLPFGEGLFGKRDRDHFRHGDRDFHFEFRGPEGSFEFDPGEHDFPFGERGLEGLLERFDNEDFEGLEGFEGLEELFERFQGHQLFELPFEDFMPPTVEPDTSATSA
jgi:hypothetical protein